MARDLAIDLGTSNLRVVRAREGIVLDAIAHHDPDDWTDDRSGDYAVRFLEKGRAKDRPFLLVVGFKAPHGPFTPPRRLEAAS